MISLKNLNYRTPRKTYLHYLHTGVKQEGGAAVSPYPKRVNTTAKMLKYGQKAGIGVFKYHPPKRKSFNERMAERLQEEENRPERGNAQDGKAE